MVKIYFKTTLRYLWRNRLFTTLNILGLAVGISVCWMIFVIVNYESRFNKDIPDGGRVFQVVSDLAGVPRPMVGYAANEIRSEEHTSELQSLMRISYAVFCLKKKHITYN